MLGKVEKREKKLSVIKDEGKEYFEFRASQFFFLFFIAKSTHILAT